MIDFGFGVTRTAACDLPYQMAAEQVFGILIRNDEFEETPDSPFIAGEHRPNTGAGSLYELILNDKPLAKIASTEAPEEIQLTDVSMDLDLMNQIGVEVAGAEYDPELNEIVDPNEEEKEEVSEC